MRIRCVIIEMIVHFNFIEMEIEGRVFMMSSKCGKKICPVSFGLALGLACGLAVFIWTLWILYYGATPMMAAYHTPATLGEGSIMALWCLLKGFVFGFFIALFYNLISCCCPCCKRPDGACCCCGKPKSV
jgi:hypothetical protein